MRVPARPCLSGFSAKISALADSNVPHAAVAIAVDVSVCVMQISTTTPPVSCVSEQVTTMQIRRGGRWEQCRAGGAVAVSEGRKGVGRVERGSHGRGYQAERVTMCIVVVTSVVQDSFYQYQMYQRSLPTLQYEKHCSSLPFARGCRLGVWFGFVGAALLPAVGTCVVLAFGAMPGRCCFLRVTHCGM